MKQGSLSKQFQTYLEFRSNFLSLHEDSSQCHVRFLTQVIQCAGFLFYE